MRDAQHDLVANFTIKPQTVTTSNANGSGIDLLGYRGAKVVIHTGAVGALQDATNKCTFGIFDSPDNSTFTAVSDDDLIGGNNTVLIDANAEANSTHSRAYVGTARYLAVRCAVNGTISLPICAEVILYKPLHVG